MATPMTMSYLATPSVASSVFISSALWLLIGIRSGPPHGRGTLQGSDEPAGVDVGSAAHRIRRGSSTEPGHGLSLPYVPTAAAFLSVAGRSVLLQPQTAALGSGGATSVRATAGASAARHRSCAGDVSALVRAAQAGAAPPGATTDRRSCAAAAIFARATLAWKPTLRTYTQLRAVQFSRSKQRVTP